MDISVVRQTKTDLGVDLQALLNAASVVLANDFYPVWGRTATMQIESTPTGDAAILITDNATVANALGYHDLINGVPTTHLFAQTILKAGERFDATFYHELFEMILDPPASIWVLNPVEKHVEALEASDSVEESSYAGPGGFMVSDFVYPEYFGYYKGTKFDKMGVLNKAFSLAPGGYKIVMKQGKVSQQFGSLAKRKRFMLEDRRLHRSERRHNILGVL